MFILIPQPGNDHRTSAIESTAVISYVTRSSSSKIVISASAATKYKKYIAMSAPGLSFNAGIDRYLLARVSSSPTAVLTSLLNTYFFYSCTISQQ